MKTKTNSGSLGPASPLTPDECYRIALQHYANEFRTLGERANVFAVVQSILIGASALILINQGAFGYIFPYMFSGMVAIGTLFCLLHFLAGRMGAANVFAWTQYMRSIEQSYPNLPLAWFYASYEKRYGDKKALKELPLPSNWLCPPAIFLLIWFIASAYIPSRVLIDCGFAVGSHRPAVLAISIAIGVCILILFCLLIRKTIACSKMFKSVIKHSLLSRDEG